MTMRQYYWVPLCLVLTLGGDGALAHDSAVPEFSLRVETPETVFLLPDWTQELTDRAHKPFALVSVFHDKIEAALQGKPGWQSHVRGIVPGGERGEEFLSPEALVWTAEAVGLSVQPVLIFYENAHNDRFFGPKNFNHSFLSFDATGDSVGIESLGRELKFERTGINPRSYQIKPLAVIDLSAKTRYAGFAICNADCADDELMSLKELLQNVAQIDILPHAEEATETEEAVLAQPNQALQVEIFGAETGTSPDRVYHLAAGSSCDSRQLIGQTVVTAEGRAKIAVPIGAERFCLFVARAPQDLYGDVYCRSLRADWNVQVAAEDIEARPSACRPPKTPVKLVVSVKDLNDITIFDSSDEDADLAAQLDELRTTGRGLRRGGREVKVTHGVIELPRDDLQRYTDDPNRSAFKAHGYDVESHFDADSRVWEVVLHQTFVSLEGFKLQLRLSGDTQTYLYCRPELRLILIGSDEVNRIDLQAVPERDGYVVPVAYAKTVFDSVEGARVEIDLGANSACRVNGERVVPISAEQLRTGLAELELEEAKRTMVVLISGDRARQEVLNVSDLVAGIIAKDTMARLSDFIVAEGDEPYERVVVGAALGTDAAKRSSTYVANSRDEVETQFGAGAWSPEITAQYDTLFNKLGGDPEPLQLNRAFVQVLKDTLRVDSDGPLPEADILLLLLGADVGQPNESLCVLFTNDRKGKIATKHLRGKNRIFAISLGASNDVDLDGAFADDKQPGHSCDMSESWRSIGVAGYVMNTSLLPVEIGRKNALDAAFEAAYRHFHKEPTQ